MLAAVPRNWRSRSGGAVPRPGGEPGLLGAGRGAEAAAAGFGAGELRRVGASGR